MIKCGNEITGIKLHSFISAVIPAVCIQSYFRTFNMAMHADFFAAIKEAIFKFKTEKPIYTYVLIALKSCRPFSFFHIPL
jgi:hypothetical protein